MSSTRRAHQLVNEIERALAAAAGASPAKAALHFERASALAEEAYRALRGAACKLPNMTGDRAWLEARARRLRQLARRCDALAEGVRLPHQQVFRRDGHA